MQGKRFRFFLGAIALLAVGAAVPDNKDLRTLLSSLVNFTTKFPREKIYVHTDRLLYSPSDTLWFCAYAVNAAYPQQPPPSKILYVELLSQRQGTLGRRTLMVAEDGTAKGEIAIPDSLPDGYYTLRAYTSYMRNFDSIFYQKPIHIHSNDRSAEVVSHRSRPDLQILPEGGTAIAGFESRFGIKCISSDGTELNLKGIIVNSGGKQVSQFETSHNGMGSAKVVIKKGERYAAVIRYGGDSLVYPFPKIETEGYSMRVTDLGRRYKVSVVATNSLRGKGGYLIIHNNGLPSFSAKGNFEKGSLITYVKKELLPSGVSLVTLLDESLKPQCERAIFVNHKALPKVEVHLPVTSHRKREEVVIHGKVTSATAIPEGATFSVSVSKIDGVGSTKDFSGNIVASILLTSHLFGEISGPDYYLSDTTATVRSNVDLLMLTHGWRKFHWEKLHREEDLTLDFPAESGLKLSGKLQQEGYRGKQGPVKAIVAGSDFITTQPNDAGEFVLSDLIFFDSATVVVETSDEKGRPRNFNLSLDLFDPRPPVFGLKNFSCQQMAQQFIYQSTLRQNVEQTIKLENGTTLLDAVVVQANRIEDFAVSELTPLHWKPDTRVPGTRLLNGYSNVAESMMGVAPGVSVVGEGEDARIIIRGKAPTILYNGFKVDPSFLTYIQKSEIDHVDITKEVGYGGEGQGSIVAFYSKQATGGEAVVRGIYNRKFAGLSVSREFYSPNYKVPANRHKYPDYRHTLFWNAGIKTSKDGEFVVAFHTGDIAGRYLLVVEGLTAAKQPFQTSAELVVQ